MEDQTAVPENASGDFESAAAKLRALRQRADQALEEQRQRLGSIESELANRVRYLAKEFDQTVAARQVGRRMNDGAEQMQLQAARASLDEVRKRCEQLEKERAVVDDQLRKDAAERERLLELLRKAQDQLREQRDAAQVEASLCDVQRERDEALGHIEILQAEAEELRAQAGSAATIQAQLEQLQTDAQQRQSDAERQLAEAASQIESLQEKHQQLASQSGESADLQQLLDEAHEQLGAARAENADLKSEAEAASEHAEQLADMESELERVTVQFDSLRAQLNEQRAQLEAANAQTGELRQQNKQLQQDLEQVAQVEADLHETQESLARAQDQIAQLQAQLVEREERSHQQLEEVQERCDAAETSLTELQGDLTAAQTQLKNAESENANLAAQLEGEGDSAARFGELQQELEQTREKFDLTLGDVQKLKRENEALREELDSRPEADDGDSPELVAVRAERDALADRIDELESDVAPVMDADTQEQYADLQRRFEMAVDDLRQLKQENAELRAAPSASPPPVDPGAPLDWQAQKAQLLAMLDDEESDGIADEHRQADRVTVEGAISITDQVVADKEREIAELRAELEQRAAQRTAEEAKLPPTAAEQAADSDQVIQQQRQELEQLKLEWQEKLRTAELEISVERAKIARDQAELRSKLADFDGQLSESPEENASGKPRRRWLAALGLGDEDGEDA